MAKTSVYLPDELAAAVKQRGFSLTALLRQAVQTALVRSGPGRLQKLNVSDLTVGEVLARMQAGDIPLTAQFQGEMEYGEPGAFLMWAEPLAGFQEGEPA